MRRQGHRRARRRASVMGALGAARGSDSANNAPLDRTRPRGHHETKLSGMGSE